MSIKASQVTRAKRWEQAFGFNNLDGFPVKREFGLGAGANEISNL
jgi:hypothetical protein